MLNIRNYTGGVICYFWRNPLMLALVMSLSLLLGAYGFQYIGGLVPCHLCWWQRYAHMAIFALSAGGLLLVKNIGPFQRRLWALATVIALCSSVVAAGYHTGVEQKWWQGPTTCTSSGLTDPGDMATLFDNMMAAEMVMCDKISWQMFGISMAGYNFLISLAVALFVTSALLINSRKNNDG